jgi:hypothetical protein
MSRQYKRVFLSESDGGVVKVLQNFPVDTTFDPSANSVVNSVDLQSDGKILLGGSFTSVGGVTRNRIARVFENGSLDTTFNPNVDNSVFSVALQSDGNILLGGSFTSVGGANRLRIARIFENDGIIHVSNVDSNVSDEVFLSVFAEQPTDISFYVPSFDGEDDSDSLIRVSVSPEDGAVDVLPGISIAGDGVNPARIRATTDSGEATIRGYINRLG